MDTILKIENISKHFPGVKALDSVNVEITRGEIHAIVGENGAGKSTLMKILGGLYEADSGSIYINGKKTDIKTIQDSVSNGISVIYQEFNLVPLLTVAENIYMTRLPGKFGVVSKNSLNKKCRELFDEIGIDISPTKLVSELSVSEMQMVEIAKAVSFESEIIIMDEPTAALNDNEVMTLYKLIKMLKDKNKTILYISHRLKEIFDLSDRITILRDGQKIQTVPTSDITEDELVKKMVGRDVGQFYHVESNRESKKGDVRLKVSGLSKKGFYENIDFELCAGEILGFAGLMGCRKEEIAKTVFGLIHADSGTICVDGEAITINNPRDAISHKIMFTTDDRKNEGILPYLSVRQNLTIAVLDQLCKKGNGIVDTRKENEILEKYTEEINIKYASEDQNLVNLSGGNQQKVLLARSLASGCKILILLEPTRGIDVGAKSEIYRILKELAAQGLAILLITSETQELITLCDRVMVVYQGTITGEFEKNNKSAGITEDNIMFCSTGKKRIFYKEESV